MASLKGNGIIYWRVRDKQEERTITAPLIHECQCPLCQQAGEPPEKHQHAQMNLFLSRLNEQQRRWFVALEAQQRGHGGEKLLSQITGLDGKTIRRGIRELENGLADRPLEKIRQPGGGRPSLEKKRPAALKRPDGLGRA